MGDDWKHIIQLVRIIDEYNEESPYLLEVQGQAPLEDACGVSGFIDFYKIMLNPDHAEDVEMKA